MPMSKSQDRPQPYRLCCPGLGSPHAGRLRNSSGHLSGQEWTSLRLFAPTTQITVYSNGSCVSPDSIIRSLLSTYCRGESSERSPLQQFKQAQCKYLSIFFMQFSLWECPIG